MTIRRRATARDLEEAKRHPNIDYGYIEAYVCDCGLHITARTPAAMVALTVAHWKECETHARKAKP